MLLLLSLAASFAFGLMIGKGQADERLVVRKETPIVTEASLAPKKSDGRIVELGVTADDFEQTETAAPTESVAAATETLAVVEETSPVTETAVPAPATTVAAETAADQSAGTPALPRVPHFAQLLSTSDQKTAEAFAAKLIERGFTSAYVERGAATEKGPVYRVRVQFPSESEARAAEPKLREFSKEVWIASR
ncbi:MAG TPA: SPOR domain-containing protein [Thermoanaerobaculia bacterium]|nr:SPOR domain-containing protein [Thermoanaerobaculia bacterium]